MIDEGSISRVLEVLRPERAALLDVLSGLSPQDWALATECPAYTIKGVAAHVLGDDLSLLSRQRDGAVPGLLQIASELPGTDFMTLLDAFNDRWVAAAGFLSSNLLVDLLRLSGEWTADYYHAVDPAAPGEPVGFFGTGSSTSPFWQAIAREFVERWVHHSQIRRALGMTSLSDVTFLRVGFEVIATAGGMEPLGPRGEAGDWAFGSVILGSGQHTADILTRRYTSDEVRALVTGPAEAVETVARAAGRR